MILFSLACLPRERLKCFKTVNSGTKGSGGSIFSRPLCSSAAMLIQSTAVAALRFSQKRSAELGDSGTGDKKKNFKKEGATEEKENRRLTVSQQTQLVKKRGCPPPNGPRKLRRPVKGG